MGEQGLAESTTGFRWDSAVLQPTAKRADALPCAQTPPVRTWERAINLEDSCETAESQQKPAPFLSDRLSPMCVPPSPGRESLPHPHPSTDHPIGPSRGSRSEPGAKRLDNRRRVPDS